MDSRTYFYSQFKINIPSNIIVGGPTMSGKSTLIEKIIENAKNLFDPEPQSILYCYGVYDERIHSMFESKGAILHAGVPSLDEIEELEKPLLLILDDLMGDLNDKYLKDLFTKYAHHNNMCVIFVTQYWFEKQMLVARNNAQYLFIMNSPNALRQVAALGNQLCPGERDHFMRSYKKAVSKKFGYLFIDNHPRSDRRLQLRTNIFPGEELIVYMPH